MVRNIIQYSVVGLLLSGIVPMTYAFPEKEKNNIIEKKITERGKKELEQAYEGIIESMEQVGSFYRYGKEGFEQQPNRAIEWLEKAGEKKSGRALYDLGEMYEQGEGIEKDYDKALEYYRLALQAGAKDADLLVRLGDLRIKKSVEYKKTGVQLIYQAAQTGDIQAMKTLGDFYYYGKYLKQNYKKALVYYRKIAQKGNDDGIYMMAKMLECGMGADQDYPRAFRLYKRLVTQGHGDAMYKLGRMYHNGKVKGKVDDKEARIWYSKAIEKGNINALSALGELHYYGLGGKINVKEAMRLFKKASGNGDGLGKFYIGFVHLSGGGIKRNKKKAEKLLEGTAKLLRKLGEDGEERAYFRLGLLYNRGYGGVKEDDEKGHLYYQKAVKFGDSLAMVHLGYNYYYAEGKMRDREKAVQLFRKSAELGNVNGINALARTYRYGCRYVIDRDMNKAIQLYEKSAGLGSTRAMNVLGDMYKFGQGVEKDCSKAIQWYRKSVNLGSSNAMHWLGTMYESGKEGLEQDYDKAMKLFREAAKLGNPDAMNSIGYLYYDGRGVPQDRVEAEKWFEKEEEYKRNVHE